MSTVQPRRLARIHWLLPGLLLLGACWGCQPRITETGEDWPPLLPHNPFVVRNYGGKCLDFGAPPHVSGEPVFIYDCNGTAAQRVVPVEIDPDPADLHQVVLYAGDKVIGVMGNALIQQAPLELQDYNGSPGQIFELDGDSIILAADRQLVVEVQHARGENLTPVWLGNRDLADAEFWEFTASDGANHRPTRGFVRISQMDDNGGEVRARRTFLKALRNAHPGTVIELDPNVAINLTGLGWLEIKEGVTIRGDRRGTRRGPEIYTARNDTAHILFNIVGSEVRLTGLRLRGPSRSLDKGQVSRAIVAHVQHTTIIDHNELSDWPIATVEVHGDGRQDDGELRPENVRVARNFIHHNRGDRSGYGVSPGGGGWASIEGNTFLENRHAIAGDGTANSGYRAWFNLVLHDGPDYGNGIQQDFDMHGTGNRGYGGIAGKYIEIARNTFLGGDRENFYLRGTPTYLAEFHHNVSVGPRLLVIKNDGDTDKLIVSDNHFLAPNPTRRLGVGDFDGDGKDDLFLATGAAWYYAPAGQAEWRYLNAQTDKIGTLLFGDFDADGRTDVFTQHDGSRWDVSWGGASRWETINGSGPLLGDATIGDFDGDRRADVFYANGHEWQVSFSGTGYFTHYALAIHRVSDLRFGDFNDDGKTDVFGVVGDQWMVVYGGTQFWAPLRARLSDSVSGLTVADFNGDGRADVARSISLLGLGLWQVSWGGASDWTRLRADRRSLSSLPAIGRFDDAPGADVLTWAPGNVLNIASGGAGATQTHSRQDMR